MQNTFVHFADVAIRPMAADITIFSIVVYAYAHVTAVWFAVFPLTKS